MEDLRGRVRDEASLVHYERESHEATSEALLSAFESAGVDVLETDTTLYEHVDLESLDRLTARAGRDLWISFLAWGHRVVLTPETVELYDVE